MIRPRRCLLVDDNAALAENLAEILVDHGHLAIGLSDPEAALDLLKREPFDVVITDLRMPGLDGAQLIRRIRAHDQGLPVVVLTAMPTHQALPAARLEGLLRVLPKPVPIVQLLEALELARRDSTVLLVEDDDSMREILCEALNSRGLSVVPVARLSELERVLDTVRPFLALVDLKLPDGKVGAAVETVARRLKGTPTLVITAFADQWGDGEFEVIRKPLDTGALLDRIERLHRERVT